MNSHEVQALIAEAIDTVCPTLEHPFQERHVLLWVLQQASVRTCTRSDENETVHLELRNEIVKQLRSKTDQAGERMYFAGRGKQGRYVWYPVRLIRQRADGDEGLMRQLLLALHRQDAAYQGA